MLIRHAWSLAKTECAICRCDASMRTETVELRASRSQVVASSRQRLANATHDSRNTSWLEVFRHRSEHVPRTFTRHTDKHRNTWNEWTVPSKMMDHLSSVSLLMSVESNSGVQMREELSHGQALRLLQGRTPFRTALLCSRASTREFSNWVTASWHIVLQAERSWVSSPRADGSMPHCFMLTFRASLYCKTGPHCRRFPTASCPRYTCFGIRLSGIRHTDRQTDRQTDRDWW